MCPCIIYLTIYRMTTSTWNANSILLTESILAHTTMTAILCRCCRTNTTISRSWLASFHIEVSFILTSCTIHVWAFHFWASSGDGIVDKINIVTFTPVFVEISNYSKWCAMEMRCKIFPFSIGTTSFCIEWRKFFSFFENIWILGKNWAFNNKLIF